MTPAAQTATSKSSEKDDVTPHVSPEQAAAATIHDPGDTDFHVNVGPEPKNVKAVEPTKPVASTRVIQTPEDAVMAFLREEIDEKELRSLYASLGGSPGSQSLPDDQAFARSIPDDLKTPGKSPYEDVEYAKKVVEEKQKIREAATKAAEDVSDDKEVLTAETLANRKNEAALAAAKKVVSK